MDKNTTYSDCELKYIREEGLEASRAAEVCASEESRKAYEEGKSSKDESWDFYWD